jgi:hypothetical protein
MKIIFMTGNSEESIDVSKSFQCFMCEIFYYFNLLSYLEILSNSKIKVIIFKYEILIYMMVVDDDIYI